MTRGTPPTRASVRGMIIGSTVLVAASVVAFLATRGGATPSTSGHDHSTHGIAAGGSAAAVPVSLTSEQAQRIGVTYATAEIGTVQREIRTVGQVTFDESRMQAISPKVDGWVERLHVSTTGQPISRGQPLLDIYSPMLVAAQEELLLAARLAVDVVGGSAEAQRSAQELLQAARRRLAYWDIPESEIAAIERSGQVRRTLTLRAPAGGFVLEKNVLAGQRIMAGDALYRVADLGTVWIEGEVFEQDLAGIRLGQLVHADLQALPDNHFMGRISYVYPTMNPETRTARVRMELSNTPLILRPGMYATLRIEGAGRTGVLTVPRSAVLVTGERSVVFVGRADGRLEPRDVRIGLAGADRIEILAGLSEGDRVAASATFLIDAESNLSAALGAMGDSPAAGMPAPNGGPAMRSAPASDHSGHAGHED